MSVASSAASPVRLAFQQLALGNVFETSETFDAAAMDRFAALSGDDSPIHADAAAAQQHGFPGRLQYGFLLLLLVSRIVGTRFENAICASVSVDFLKPVIEGQRVDASASVRQIQQSTRTVVLTLAMRLEGELVLRGKLTTVFL